MCGVGFWGFSNLPIWRVHTVSSTKRAWRTLSTWTIPWLHLRLHGSITTIWPVRGTQACPVQRLACWWGVLSSASFRLVRTCSWRWVCSWPVWGHITHTATSWCLWQTFRSFRFGLPFRLTYNSESLKLKFKIVFNLVNFYSEFLLLLLLELEHFQINFKIFFSLCHLFSKLKFWVLELKTCSCDLLSQLLNIHSFHSEITANSLI